MSRPFEWEYLDKFVHKSGTETHVGLSDSIYVITCENKFVQVSKINPYVNYTNKRRYYKLMYTNLKLAKKTQFELEQLFPDYEFSVKKLQLTEE